ncbi:MAG: metallophosphoesterase family protein [Candidatus Bathycorpusculaceae bacterium]
MGVENNLSIVHLSDIHAGAKLERNMLERAMDEINKLNPDLVIVTGDLTDEGLLEEFQEAHNYLQSLKCKHMIVGSGNHDSRNTGYRLFPKFFGNSSSITELNGIVVIMLDSSRPDQDEGEVGYRQRLWLKQCLEENHEKFKIVALHHHLLPVPDTGMEKNIIVDAGDVLWTLVSYGVDLVLCGHRHRPWIWNLAGLSIVYAGAVSTSRLRGFYQNSFNIINIEDGKVNVRLKIIGGNEHVFEPKVIKMLQTV